jgi:DNA-binding IclR family transcriptional regulator
VRIILKLIRSLQKGIDILFLLSGEHSSMTVEEIGSFIHMPIPSVYRFIATLRENGLVERDAETGKYSLGLKLLELEASIHRKLDLETISAPFLKELAQKSGETVQLTILNDKRGICVLVEESTSTLRMAPEKGRSLPLHAGASAQVIMAFLPEETQKRICKKPLERFTPETIVNSADLAKRLKIIRRQGFAETSGEVYIGSVGIAAPILDNHQKVIASIAVSGPEQRMVEKREIIRKEIVDVTNKISSILGHKRLAA